MRLKRSRLNNLGHMRMVPLKNNEGSSYPSYDQEVGFVGEVWPASGKLQAEMYGQRLPYIRNVRVNGKYQKVVGEDGIISYRIAGYSREVNSNGDHITTSNGAYVICDVTPVDVREGDGLCLDVPGGSGPDYRIIAIRPDRFLRLEAEKI